MLELLDGRGASVRLGTTQLGKGGEGAVWDVADYPNLVAKLYNKPLAPEKIDKLTFMVSQSANNKPLLQVAAWPTDTLRDAGTGKVIGFLMSKVAGFKPVHQLYGVQSRKNEFPSASWAFLITTARNIACVFEGLHRLGHVIGDVNENNVLVSPNDATVRLIDCDSFQIKGQHRNFHCEVGVPLFTPPELQGHSLRNVDRTLNHDRFGLAVLVFQLLFLGRHPFIGRFHGHGEMPPERAIREFRFVYGRKAGQLQMEAPPLSLRLSFTSPRLADLFERAFDAAGAQGGRPVAEDWRAAIDQLRQSISTCRQDKSHAFPASIPSCPWCHFASKGVMFFVSVQLEAATVFVCRPADLDGLLAQLAALPAIDSAEPQLSAATLLPRPLPPPAASRLKGVLVMRRATMAGAVIVVAALWFGVSGTRSAVPAGFIAAFLTLATWIASRVATNGPLANELAERRRIAREREAGLKKAQAGWQQAVLGVQDAEARERRKIEEAKKEYAGLQPAYDLERRRLEEDKQSTQKRAFLRSRLIAQYDIKGIKDGRRRQLLNYGIETALDVLEKHVGQVPGFGPKLCRTLKNWANGVEASFRFDPAKGVSTSEVRLLVQGYQQRRASLRNGIEHRITNLRQLRRTGPPAFALLAQEVVRRATERDQANADLRSVPKPSLGVRFAWIGVGAAAGLGLYMLPSGQVGRPNVSQPLANPRPVVAVSPAPSPPPPPIMRIPRSCVLRAGPASGEPKMAEVAASTAVEVLASTPDQWRQVRLTSGVAGWTGPRCWLPTVGPGSPCKRDSDCSTERCTEETCE